MKHQVYVIAWSLRGPTKVGVSNNVVKRLAALQEAHPFRLQIYGAAVLLNRDLAFAIEQAVLLELSPFRLIGEWLKLPPSTVKQHVFITAKQIAHVVEKWKPTERQLQDRALALNGFNSRRYRESIRAADALATAKHLDIIVR